ncbi:MAG TPA: 30S ribosomal protein S8 [Flavobacteriales bacterium]|jgi:small subunit ribosomal protein S8|nr:30S ribosomal protein S8 [Flavobacteriales bacterium]HIA05135.1 30S ribosomal protein S8 [Flavobacteriales bacterium]
MTDPIADYLTRMRNALMAKHKVVNIPSSKIKRAMTETLLDKGYILNYKVEGSKESNRSIGTQDNLKIALKYDAETKQPAIKKLIRVSKPGLRKYANADSLPRVLNGLGVAIVSTSKGVMTDKEARKEHIGGEVLCHIY